MADKLKVGIIGVGGIARTHMPGWAASEHADLIAGSDINADVLNHWGKNNNISSLSTDPEDLFKNPDIDIIDICTPNNYHAPLAIAALEAGKHVICEKPLAPDPALIKNMIAARDKSGKTLMTAQHFRFSGKSKAMRAELDTGVLGDIYHARSWMLRRSGAPKHTGLYTKTTQRRRSLHRHRRSHPGPHTLVHGQPQTRVRHRCRPCRNRPPERRLQQLGSHPIGTVRCRRLRRSICAL